MHRTVLGVSLRACRWAGLRAGLRAAQRLAFGLIGGLAFGLRKTEPAEELNWSWPRVLISLRIGLVSGLLVGLVVGLVYGLLAGLLVGLFSGLTYVLHFGLVPRLAHERTIPNEGIHRSARHALGIGLVTGLTLGLIAGSVSRLIDGLSFGLFFGLTASLVFGGLACLQHLATRALLTIHSFAPFRYIRFLDEAAERLLLRRAGSGYIFVHRLLLDYLADQVDPSQHQET
jgi:hypothetical protein